MRALVTVIGNPIAHSLSPVIHQQFARQMGLDLHYDRTLLPKEFSVAQLQDFLKNFAEQGGLGANVTAPFKLLAYQSVATHSLMAQEAGAVNTLILKNHQWIGDNTDGVGLISDWQRLGWVVKNKRLLIVGAGGAVSGVLGSILRQEPAEVCIFNRTKNKAQQLVERFQASCLHAEPPMGPFDIVLNATSRDLSPTALNLNPTWITNAYCYDLNYQSEDETPFVLWVKEQGAIQAVGGLGMLLAQAAESFRLWFGVMPRWEDLGIYKQKFI